jgi:hypothetical protein
MDDQCVMWSTAKNYLVEILSHSCYSKRRQEFASATRCNIRCIDYPLRWLYRTVTNAKRDAEAHHNKENSLIHVDR